MDKGTQELRLMHWAELVKECHNSGMKVREWCQQNDIDEKRYYYWQRKVRQEILQIQETSTTAVEKVTTFAQLPIPIGSESKSDFQPDVVLKMGTVVIEISNTASDLLLSRVSEMIHHA